MKQLLFGIKLTIQSKKCRFKSVLIIMISFFFTLNHSLLLHKDTILNDSLKEKGEV